MKKLEVIEIKPLWLFLLQTWREHGFRTAWNYFLVFVKMKHFSPFGTVEIATFKDDEDSSP